MYKYMYMYIYSVSFDNFPNPEFDEVLAIGPLRGSGDSPPEKVLDLSDLRLILTYSDSQNLLYIMYTALYMHFFCHKLCRCSYWD